MRVAITCAAGKTARAVASALREVGVDVIPLVRRANGLPNERVVAFDSASATDAALVGADALYLIAPNVHPDEVGFVQPLIAACVRRGSAIVYHSVMHPSASAMPHHLAKAQVEDRVRTAGVPWSVLQPASYFDNVIAPIAAALDGVWHQPYSVDTLFTPIALDDVGAAAARVLLDDSHRFATYELTGTERLTSREMAGIAQRVLQRPVIVVADRDRWHRTVGADLPPESARRLGLMFDYYDVHGFAGNGHVATSLLGRRPVEFEPWIRRHLTEFDLSC